jgi:integrase
MQAIEVYTGSAMTRIAMKLMAMTFVRTSELINARWQEIDWDASRWNIPAERMKMRDPHVVPLSSQALQQLKLLHKLTGRLELMFPGERNRKTPMSNNTILKALERMGYGGRMTGHGFRGFDRTA